MAGKMLRKSAKFAKKATARRVAAKPFLLTGGNHQIAKADGDAPVQAYIAASRVGTVTSDAASTVTRTRVFFEDSGFHMSQPWGEQAFQGPELDCAKPTLGFSTEAVDGFG